MLGRRANMVARLMLAAGLCAAVLWGCGYGVRRAPGDPVRIGAIENSTYEGRLEDRLAEALASELLKNGIRVDDGADRAIEGTLETLTIESVAESDEVTTTYRITITGSFILRGP
ncbi:MAG: LPS assembly lipoprotein LptE, partial [Nitrospirota bacterium]